MPAWEAPVWDDQSVVHGASRWHPRCSHPAMRRRVPVADGALQDGVGQPVDLQEHHPRRTMVVSLRRLLLRRSGQVPQHDVVVVEGKQPR